MLSIGCHGVADLLEIMFDFLLELIFILKDVLEAVVVFTCVALLQLN